MSEQPKSYGDTFPLIDFSITLCIDRTNNTKVWLAVSSDADDSTLFKAHWHAFNSETLNDFTFDSRMGTGPYTHRFYYTFSSNAVAMAARNYLAVSFDNTSSAPGAKVKVKPGQVTTACA